MTDLTIDVVREEGERFSEAVSREHYLAGAGLKPTAELQPIYDRYREILSREALELTREAFRSAPLDSMERRSAMLLLEWQAESQSARELAALDEREIAWESQAVVTVDDGRTIPYQRAAIEIANATDRAERLRIDAARATLVARELAPLKRERLEREKDITESLGIGGSYTETFQALTGVDLPDLVSQCEGFLRDTQAMWEDVYPAVVRRVLDIPPGEAMRADALAVLRAREFDSFFPGSAMEGAVRRQTREMGIDADAGGRIVYDVEERERKRARAFCAPVRVPDEIYLVLRPHGGQSDYSTLLHELGHALHFANMRRDYPFEFRWLGDNSITEGYAMLFDHLMQDRGWLLRYTELSRAQVPAFLRAAGFEELHFLRRYCAKLIYEVDLYSGEVSWEALPDVYVSRLTGATTFRYDPADAFVDVDPRFYSARYLRAWQLQSVLADALANRFDEDWYRNPRAGPWVIGQLFAEGQRELASEQATRVTGGRLSFSPLIRAIERMLLAA